MPCGEAKMLFTKKMKKGRKEGKESYKELTSPHAMGNDNKYDPPHTPPLEFMNGACLFISLRPHGL